MAGILNSIPIAIQRDHGETVKRAAEIAVEEGEFRSDLDLDQFVFEMGSITAAYHHFGRLLGDPKAEQHALKSFDALLARSH